VRLTTGAVLPRTALVVAPRFTARSGVLSSLGLLPVQQDLGGHVYGSAVPADASGATDVPGVWVAGNVTDLRAHVVGSAAAGLAAGTTVNADLIAEDTRRAVQAGRAGPRTPTAEREHGPAGPELGGVVVQVVVPRPASATARSSPARCGPLTMIGSTGVR
jgi:hypothetical protein